MGGKVSFPRTPLSKDKVVIVTGGNTGIGYETAKWIAMLGASVIIACRSEQRAMEAIDRMKTEFQAEKEKGTEGVTQTTELTIEFMQLDLTSLNSTKTFIEQFKASGRKLNVLVCNAGIVYVPLEYTEDGNEMMFQVNYLSHLLLTLELLPIMKQSGDDNRIVLVSSKAHEYHTTPFSVENIAAKQYNKESFPRFKYYGNSKLYQVMQMYFMNRKLKDSNVIVSSLHPGVVNTELSRGFQDMGWMVRGMKLFSGFLKSPAEGAETSINAAINPDLKGVRDIYYSNCKPTNTHSDARNERFQEELLNFSMELLKNYITDTENQFNNLLVQKDG